MVGDWAALNRLAQRPRTDPTQPGGSPRVEWHNRIVAFEGEVMPQYNIPLQHHFAEEDAALLQLQELPTSALSHAAEFYRYDEKTTISICARSHPLATIWAAQSRWAGTSS